MTSTGKSIRLFLVDGSPGGLLTAEIMNWTGHVLAAPRSDLAVLVSREEVKRTGIYILVGDDPENPGSQLAYIGESDDVADRIKQHAKPEQGSRGKDFWDRVIVLTSKDANVTKTHARYLESRLIQLARLASRVRLENNTNPPTVNIPEAEASDMEQFIVQTQIVLPILGVNIFRSAATSGAIQQEFGPSAEGPRSDSPLFELRLNRENIAATAREVDGEFTVLTGSDVRDRWVGNDHHDGYNTIRKQLLHDGTIAPSGSDSHLRFTRDAVFSSPSAAAAVVVGRGANGRTDWRVRGSGVTYGGWQAQGVDFNPDPGSNTDD